MLEREPATLRVTVTDDGVGGARITPESGLAGLRDRLEALDATLSVESGEGTTVCAEFLSYQWDALLLEAGALAILVARPVWRDRARDFADPPRPATWLMLWLLFRLMFESGCVKLLSGDPTWRK